MPTVIAKKALAFSLVSINVGVVAATGEHRVPLHEVHVKDGGSLGARCGARRVGTTRCSSAPVQARLPCATSVVLSLVRVIVGLVVMSALATGVVARRTYIPGHGGVQQRRTWC